MSTMQKGGEKFKFSIGNFKLGATISIKNLEERNF